MVWVTKKIGGETPATSRRLIGACETVALTTAPTLLRSGALVILGGWKPGVMLCVLVGLATGLVYWAYARAQQLVDVSVLAIFLCTIPVFALGFAHVLLGERLTPRLLLGAAVILAGIVGLATQEGLAPGGGAALVDAALLRPEQATSRGSHLDSSRNP